MLGRTVPVKRNHLDREHQRSIGRYLGGGGGPGLTGAAVAVRRSEKGFGGLPVPHSLNGLIEAADYRRILRLERHHERVVLGRAAVIVDVVLARRIGDIRVEDESVHKTPHIVDVSYRVVLDRRGIEPRAERPAVKPRLQRVGYGLSPVTGRILGHFVALVPKRVRNDLLQLQIHDDRRLGRNARYLPLIPSGKRPAVVAVSERVGNVHPDAIPLVHRTHGVVHALRQVAVLVELNHLGHIVRKVLESTLLDGYRAVARDEHVAVDHDPAGIVQLYPVVLDRGLDYSRGGVQFLDVNARRLLLRAVAVQAHPCVESGHLLLAQIIRRLLGTGSGHDRDDRHGPCNAHCSIHS